MPGFKSHVRGVEWFDPRQAGPVNALQVKANYASGAKLLNRAEKKHSVLSRDLGLSEIDIRESRYTRKYHIFLCLKSMSLSLSEKGCNMPNCP